MALLAYQGHNCAYIMEERAQIGWLSTDISEFSEKY